MMLESGPIRLVRPSAVSITHKMLASGPTLENCIHKDRRRNVGCVHHNRWYWPVLQKYTAVLQYLYHQYYYYAVQHVSQAPPGRAKCPADPHARRRPKREAEGREPAAAGHGDRGAILAGAAVSPPGPQRIIAQMLRACGIQVQVIKYSNNI